MKIEVLRSDDLFFDDGKVTAAITRTVESDQKPTDTSDNNDKCDVYKDWFETEEAANQFIKDAKEA